MVEFLVRLFLLLPSMGTPECARGPAGEANCELQSSVPAPRQQKYDVLLALREKALLPVSDPIHLPGSVRFTDGVLILLTPRTRPWGGRSRCNTFLLEVEK